MKLIRFDISGDFMKDENVELVEAILLLFAYLASSQSFASIYSDFNSLVMMSIANKHFEILKFFEK